MPTDLICTRPSLPETSRARYSKRIALNHKHIYPDCRIARNTPPSTSAVNDFRSKRTEPLHTHDILRGFTWAGGKGRNSHKKAAHAMPRSLRKHIKTPPTSFEINANLERFGDLIRDHRIGHEKNQTMSYITGIRVSLHCQGRD